MLIKHTLKHTPLYIKATSYIKYRSRRRPQNIRLLIFASFIFSTSALSQDLCKYTHLKGKMDNKDIYMNLVFSPKTITGTYYYADSDVYFTLDGEPEEDQNITLTAYNDKSENIGIFNGEWTNDTFIGQWQSTEEDLELNFELVPNYDNALKFNCLWLDQQKHLQDNKQYAAAFITILYLYPDSNSYRKIYDHNARFFFEDDNQNYTPIQNITSTQTNFIDRFETEMDETTNSNCGLTLKNAILFNEQNILTTVKEKWEFYGGAHGILNFSYAVYQVNTGKQIELYEILKPESQDQVADIISQKIREKFDLADNQALTDIGFNSEKIYPNEQNFYLHQKGIGFYYNPYEIAGYALGPTEIFIPFVEIKQYLRADGIANHLYK